MSRYPDGTCFQCRAAPAMPGERCPKCGTVNPDGATLPAADYAATEARAVAHHAPECAWRSGGWIALGRCTCAENDARARGVARYSGEPGTSPTGRWKATQRPLK